jgi:hypothetical protein
MMIFRLIVIGWIFVIGLIGTAYLLFAFLHSLSHPNG